MKTRFLVSNVDEGGVAPITGGRKVFFGELADLQWLSRHLPGKVQTWDPDGIRLSEPEQRLDGSGKVKIHDGAWITVK